MGLLQRLLGRGASSGSPRGEGAAAPPGLRLADPHHPCREVLARVAAIVGQAVHVEHSADGMVTRFSTDPSGVARAIALLDEAAASAPQDPDLLVAKACLQHASVQFKSAEETLDRALAVDPGHFEAKTWKEHWESWATALAFPEWDEGSSSLHPAMAAHLRQDRRVQIVREGMQKSLAIVTGVQGPPFEEGTRVKVAWVLSKAPQGSLVVYYLQVVEPAGEPSTLEGFLPIIQPARFSPMEGHFLLQQLAFTPSLFAVLVSDGRVLLNQRAVLGREATARVREMARTVGVTRPYLPPDRLREAAQWHMNHFDVAGVVFD